MMKPTRAIGSIFLVLIFFVGIIAAQGGFDWSRVASPPSPVLFSADFYRMFDLGLHSAVASALWFSNITEFPYFSKGQPAFFHFFGVITALDPRFSFPYAYAVLVLPFSRNVPDRIDRAVEIGERGMRFADPDWRIPFYLGVLYHAYRDDFPRAAALFDLAAQTTEVPPAARSFSLNYGIAPKFRPRVAAYWRETAENTSDSALRARAETYVSRMELFDTMQRTVDAFARSHDRMPQDLDEIVRAGFLDRVPDDPFGTGFALVDDGVVGIRKETAR